MYMGTDGFSPGIKRPGREADHSHPTNAEVKKMFIPPTFHLLNVFLQIANTLGFS
jgi:hypothetical protein